MPYNCEECNIIGAKLNNLVEKRLCKDCLKSDNYILICKSMVKSKYNYKNNDFENYPYRVIYTNNPFYKSASGMNLFYEKEIKKYFIEKHKAIVIKNINQLNYKLNYEINYELNYKLGNNIVINDNVIDYENLSNETINSLVKHIEEYIEIEKDNKKEVLLDKLLEKYDIIKEELPASVLDEIEYSSIKNLKNIVLYFARKKELFEILKKHDIENCITMKICSDFINGIIEDKAYEVKDKIKIYLEKN
jgi:hypothetical protein